MHIHTHVRAHMHTCAHTYTGHIYMHMRAHTHTHTHTEHKPRLSPQCAGKSCGISDVYVIELIYVIELNSFKCDLLLG